MLPATYLQYGGSWIRSATSSSLESRSCSPLRGYRFENMSAHYKSVAARTSIVTYGRNNTPMRRGAGADHQLLGFFTNAKPPMPVEMVDPEKPLDTRAIRPCAWDAIACVRACPTGALTGDRFISMPLAA